MKYLALSALMVCLTSPAFAICEGVDLNELNKKLEVVIADGGFGDAINNKLNEQVKAGPERLCLGKIIQAESSGENLTAEQKEVFETYDIVKGLAN